MESLFSLAGDVTAKAAEVEKGLEKKASSWWGSSKAEAGAKVEDVNAEVTAIRVCFSFPSTSHHLTD